MISKLSQGVITTMMITLGTAMITTTTTGLYPSYSFINSDPDPATKAPAVVSGDNVYVVWWTNRTSNANGEVMFRGSTDGGTTFGNKTNLSNTTMTDSVDAEIAAEGGNVIVTWWERNQTANEPVTRVSTDNGATFGPTLMLATNGTIGEAAEEEPEEGE
jgi:hypothetical protein